MSALLDGFNAGLKIGQPIAERRARKKELAGRDAEAEKDRQLTRDEGAANRALAKTRMRKTLRQTAELHAAGITSNEEIAGDANTTRKEIAGDANTSRETIASDANTSREKLAADAALAQGGRDKDTAEFRKKQLGNQTKGLALQKARDREAAKTDFQRVQDQMQEDQTEIDDLTESLNVMGMPADERKTIETRLRVLNTSSQIMAKGFDMALNSDDPTAMSRQVGMYTDRKRIPNNQYVGGTFDAHGERIENSGSYDANTGEFTPFGQKPAGGKGGGGKGGGGNFGGTPQNKGGLSLDKDGTLNGVGSTDDAFRPLGGGSSGGDARFGGGSSGVKSQFPVGGADFPVSGLGGSSGGDARFGGGSSGRDAPSPTEINVNVPDPAAKQMNQYGNSLL